MEECREPRWQKLVTYYNHWEPILVSVTCLLLSVICFLITDI